MKEKKQFHILLIYNNMIPSIRLCAYTQLEELSEQGKLSYRAVRYGSITKEDFEWANLLIFGRSDSWLEFVLAKKAQKAGKYVAYIMDDDLLNAPQTLQSASHLNRKDIHRNIVKILSVTDIMISPSPILLEQYASDRSGRTPLPVEEPAILPVGYMPRNPENPVRIGFAGSIDRANDIEEILKTALLKIKQEYAEKVSFFFYGAIPSFARELNAETIDYCDSYETYRETMNKLRWDIGLAPMPETSFHRCKHYNKFIEYSASGVVGIYSDVPPYDRLKKWEDCAVFCPNSSEAWYREIKALLDDPKKLEAMRKNVCHCSMTDLSIRKISEDFFNELQKCTEKEKKEASVFLGLRLYKTVHFFIKVFYFTLYNRKNFLSALKKKMAQRKIYLKEQN